MRLIFPIQKPPTASSPRSQGSESISPLQILCIDDEPQLREIMKEILTREGHRVHLADGGQAGVNAFRQARQRDEPFDVVITDLGMPYVDGRQVAQTIKGESPRTPVLMLTGWGALLAGDDRELPKHVDGVLSKPPRITVLRDALANIAGGCSRSE